MNGPDDEPGLARDESPCARDWLGDVITELSRRVGRDAVDETLWRSTGLAMHFYETADEAVIVCTHDTRGRFPWDWLVSVEPIGCSDEATSRRGVFEVLSNDGSPRILRCFDGPKTGEAEMSAPSDSDGAALLTIIRQMAVASSELSYRNPIRRDLHP